jgi:kinesin family member C2/C3
MFVQVNPDVSSYTETLSTLKFAERVSGVELGVARTNKEAKDVKELMDQVTSPPPLSLHLLSILYDSYP